MIKSRLKGVEMEAEMEAVYDCCKIIYVISKADCSNILYCIN